MAPSHIHEVQVLSENALNPTNNPVTYSIAVIPGDGIGTEVTEAALDVLRTLAQSLGTFKFQFENFDWSSTTFKERGYYIPPDGFDKLRTHDAIFFGAVGWPGKLVLDLH